MNITYNYDNKPGLIKRNNIDYVSFTYDGTGQRVKKLNYSTGQSVVYFGGLYEIRGGVGLMHKFAGNQRVASVLSDGSTQFFHSNHLGSAVVITNQNGDRKERMEYFPFGTYRETVDYDINFPDVFYTFTGQEEDDDLSLYNFVARLYDPLLGRFISPDSIVPDPTDLQSFNRYSYVRNNPLRYTDPTGNDYGPEGPASDPDDYAGRHSTSETPGFGSEPPADPSISSDPDDYAGRHPLAEVPGFTPKKDDGTLIDKVIDEILDFLSQLTGIPRDGTYYVGIGDLGFISDTPNPNASKGTGATGTVAIAFNPTTHEMRIVLTTGEPKMDSEVKGCALGMGIVAGGVEGGISDLLGRATQVTAVGPGVSQTYIETETGKKGREYGLGKSFGLGGVEMETYTEPLRLW